MKRLWSILLLAILLFALFPEKVYAAQEDASFRYELSVDGQSEKAVQTGDIITVVLHLYRTDAEDKYTMYAMQNEIRYDSNFFELVEGSQILTPGVETTDIAMRDHYREFYMSYLSILGGEKWSAKTMVGSFQLRVIGTTGVTKISNQDFVVSRNNGEGGGYDCQANELTIILTTDCVVRFASNGGTEIDDLTAVYGETITRPADPQREGKVFAGWYKDIDCTQPWDFDKDTVSGNMTLYAKWTDAPIVDVPPELPTESPAFQWWWIVILLLVLVLVFVVLKKKANQKKSK